MNTKTCRKCNETKQEIDFYLHSKYALNRKTICITCEKLYHKNKRIMLKELGLSKYSQITKKCTCCGNISYNSINQMCKACNILHIGINLVNKNQAYMMWI